MNTVELGQFTLTQLAQQQTASRTQLVGDSHAYVTPTDTFPTATQYRASQQAYNRYLGFDSASPLRPSIATAGSLIFPIAVVPNTPGVFNARMHQPCNTCASQSCVCAHLVSLSFTSAELKIPVTLTHYDLRNSSYRLTLYRAPSVPSDQRLAFAPSYATQLHSFAVPIGVNRDYDLYKANPPHFLQIPPNSFFTFDGPFLNSQFHTANMFTGGYPVPDGADPMPSIQLQIVMASAL